LIPSFVISVRVPKMVVDTSSAKRLTISILSG
jgi:hypothetical protein